MTDRRETAIRNASAAPDWRPAEGVRLIDAEEAQRVLDAGRATGRHPDQPPAARRRPLGRPREATVPPSGPAAPRSAPTLSMAPAPPPPTKLPWGPPLPGIAGDTDGPTDGGAVDQPDDGEFVVDLRDVVDERVDAVDLHADTDAFAYAAPGGVSPVRRRPASSETRITVTGGQVLPHWTEPVGDGDGDDGGGGELLAYPGSGARWRNDHDDWDDLDAGEDLFGDADQEPRLGALDTDRSDRSDLYSFDQAFRQLQEERASGSQPAVGSDDLGPDPQPARAPGWMRRATSRRRLRPEPSAAVAPSAGAGSPAADSSAADNAASDKPVAENRASGSTASGSPAVAGRRFRRRGADLPTAELRRADLADAESPPTRRRRADLDRADLDRGDRGRGAPGPGDPNEGNPEGEPIRPRAGAGVRARIGSGSTALRRGGRRRGAPAVDATPRRRGSALASRIVVGAALVALLVVAYAIGPVALVVLAAVVVLLCAAEAYSMLQRSGFRPATLLGLAATGGLMFAAYWRGEPALPLIAVLAFAATMAWYLLGITDARPLANVAVTSMTVLWVGLLGSFAALLLRVPNGRGLFLGAVVVTVAADIVAYFGGRRWGRRPLAPKVSPGKTVEGFVAGAGAAVVAGLVIGEWVSPWGGLYHGLLLGVAVAIFAPVGDLFESLIKRDLEIKDSGTVLAGHGGLLDRFDSLLLVLPATYYLADYLHLVK